MLSEARRLTEEMELSADRAIALAVALARFSSSPSRVAEA